MGVLCIAGNAPSEPVPASDGYLLYELALDSPLIKAYDYLKIHRKDSELAAFTRELMERVHGTENYRRRRLLATLKAQLDYKFSYFSTDDDASVDLFYEKLHAIERGENPFKYDITGLRGYYAVNDNSCQPFKVSTPFDYRRSQEKYPLVLSLHHHGWSDWYRPFQGYASFLSDAIVVAPHGRGSCDYLWIAEQDVLECIKAARDEFNIDPDRIYVTGWSMGGTGSFHLPGRYPDIFAASFPRPEMPILLRGRRHGRKTGSAWIRRDYRNACSCDGRPRPSPSRKIFCTRPSPSSMVRSTRSIR
ncbi:MAG: alpha/beta hydrolase-fold protein [Planctomycetota bacterium]|nr:alpha/beta hydrolase-fold protein [Planctomycetota bacterium]